MAGRRRRENMRGPMMLLGGDATRVAHVGDPGNDIYDVYRAMHELATLEAPGLEDLDLGGIAQPAARQAIA